MQSLNLFMQKSNLHCHFSHHFRKQLACHLDVGFKSVLTEWKATSQVAIMLSNIQAKGFAFRIKLWGSVPPGDPERGHSSARRDCGFHSSCAKKWVGCRGERQQKAGSWSPSPERVCLPLFSSIPLLRSSACPMKIIFNVNIMSAVILALRWQRQDHHNSEASPVYTGKLSVN